MIGKQVIGNPTPRAEGEEKVSGRAVYAGDMTLPGMLWVKVLRSPISHGRIARLDVGKASELPGVRTVITGRDVAGRRIGRKIIDMPILADGVVRFIGEKVAAVAAASEEIAEQAVDLIEVEYEDLEPVFNPLEAMKPSAPLLHPNMVHYSGLVHEIQEPSNVVVYLAWRKGDIEAGFRHSDLVVENTFHTPLVHQAYIEPHAYLIKVNPDGGADIWASSTKSPSNLREQVAQALQLSPEKLVVHPCYIGGDFGGKGVHNDVALCYVLSQKSGSPVKMVVDYDEEFTAGNPRHASVIKVRTGVKNNGSIVAQHIDFVFDSGAYASFRPLGYLAGAHNAAGPYRIPHVLIEEHYVYTNKVPCGYARAPGQTQGFFASESQMDLVAKQLGLDPVKFRSMNLMHDGDEAPLGEVISSIKAEETLQRALQESNYYNPKAKGVGRGFGVAHYLSKGGECYVLVRVNEDSTVTVLTGVMEVGSGVYTIMCQIVAEELKTPIESVKVEVLNSSRVVTDTGVRASSSTRVHGGGAYEAAEKAREEILKIAAVCMGTTPDDLILSSGGVTHARAERRLTFGELVKAKGSPIIGEGHYNNMRVGPDASMVVQVAEVEVHPDTGEVKLRQMTSVHNTGLVLNSLTHQGQIDGGVVMGIGHALMEEMMLEEGKVLAANFGDYKIPTARDIPTLKTAVLQSTTGSGPYDSTSIGETPIIPTAAAIANAVEDAVGVRIKSLPITAEKVFEALKGK